MSRPARRIAGFVLRFALLYGILVLAWPLARPLYRPFYCFLGNVLFQGGEGSATFRSLDTDAALDVEVMLHKRSPPPATGTATNNSKGVGYLPIVTIVALVLATPIPWKRRRRALWQGLALVTLFVAVRIGIPIVRDFSKPDALQVHHPGALGVWALGVAERALLAAPASFFVVPILVWALVAFRRQDWELLERRQPTETA